MTWDSKDGLHEGSGFSKEHHLRASLAQHGLSLDCPEDKPDELGR